MDHPDTVQINFAHPVPLFPLQSVVLLPHAVAPLYIFEARYRQMVEDALDGPGLIAMATYADNPTPDPTLADPPLDPAVCLGIIEQHTKNPDGTYSIRLHGLCRAKLVHEIEKPLGVLYRQAHLTPTDNHDLTPDDRDYIHDNLVPALKQGHLATIAPLQAAIDQALDAHAPLHILVELVGLALTATIDDADLRYTILAEGHAARRARRLNRALQSLSAMLTRADHQYDPNAPKRVSWN